MDDTLAFMFESRYRFLVTEHALEHPGLQDDYGRTWDGLEDRFEPPQEGAGATES